jgi:hypothetical protein
MHPTIVTSTSVSAFLVFYDLLFAILKYCWFFYFLKRKERMGVLRPIFLVRRRIFQILPTVESWEIRRLGGNALCRAVRRCLCCLGLSACPNHSCWNGEKHDAHQEHESF